VDENENMEKDMKVYGYSNFFVIGFVPKKTVLKSQPDVEGGGKKR
jgi:hypothetical protein